MWSKFALHSIINLSTPLLHHHLAAKKLYYYLKALFLTLGWQIKYLTDCRGKDIVEINGNQNHNVLLEYFLSVLKYFCFAEYSSCNDCHKGLALFKEKVQHRKQNSKFLLAS